MSRPLVGRWLLQARRWLRTLGPHGSVWRARAQLAQVLADADVDHQLAFASLLPELDAALEVELPRLHREAVFLRGYLDDHPRPDALREVSRWERDYHTATDPALREGRRRNLELARQQLRRLDQLQTALARYEDQIAGLVLTISDAAGRVAVAQAGCDQLSDEPLANLREELDRLATELAELRSLL